MDSTGYIRTPQFYTNTNGTTYFKGQIADVNGTYITTAALDDKIWTDSTGAIRNASVNMSGKPANLYINSDGTVVNGTSNIVFNGSGNCI